VGSEAKSNQKSAEGSTFWAIVLLAALAVGLFFLVKGLVPANLPASNGSNFIDSIFHNKGVVLAARLLLVSAAVVLAVGGIYIIASTVRRMANGEWLRKAGPFEVPETAISDVESQIDKWRRAAKAGEEEVAELTERLKESDELIEQLHLEMDDG
jgi:hypothetical protein